VARYEASAQVNGVNTANSALAVLHPTTTTDRLYVVEIGIGVVTAPTAAPSFYLARSTANGTVTTTLAGQPHDPAEGAGVGTMDSVWSVAPTFSTTAKMRQAGLAAAAGGQIIWTSYDAPWTISNTVASGLVIANAVAAGATLGAFSVYMVWDE
jgi:hypothetical protein